MMTIAVHNSPFRIFTAISSSDKKLRSAKPYSCLSSDEISSSCSTKTMGLRNTDPRMSENRNKSLNAIIAQAKNLIVCSSGRALEKLNWIKMDKIKKGSVSYEVSTVK